MLHFPSSIEEPRSFSSPPPSLSPSLVSSPPSQISFGDFSANIPLSSGSISVAFFFFFSLPFNLVDRRRLLSTATHRVHLSRPLSFSPSSPSFTLTRLFDTLWNDEVVLILLLTRRTLIASALSPSHLPLLLTLSPSISLHPSLLPPPRVISRLHYTSKASVRQQNEPIDRVRSENSQEKAVLECSEGELTTCRIASYFKREMSQVSPSLPIFHVL